MPWERTFLNWDRPLGERVVEWAKSVDELSLLLVPSKWCVGKLRDRFERAGSSSTPGIHSTEELDDLLLPAHSQRLGPLESLAHWLATTASAEPELLSRVARRSHDRDLLPAASTMGTLLLELRDRLGWQGKEIKDLARTLGDDWDGDRWRALAALEDRYLCRLDEQGRVDANTYRQQCLASGACRARGSVALVGMVAWPPVAVQMLQQLADQGVSVTSLIYAPEDEAYRFDSHGAVAFAGKETHSLSDEEVVIAAHPTFESRFIVESLANATSSVVVTARSEVATRLEIDGLRAGVPVRRAIVPADQSAPVVRYLERLTRFATLGQADDFAVIIRDPWLHGWLAGPNADASDVAEDVVIAWDDWRRRHLPATVSLAELPSPRLDAVKQKLIPVVTALLREKRDIAGWAEWLEKHFPQELALTASDRDVIAGWKRFQETDGHASPVVAAHDAWRILFHERIEKSSINDDDGSVPIVGWQEALFDDHPNLLACGMNSGPLTTSLSIPLLSARQLEKLDIHADSPRSAIDGYLWDAVMTWRSTRKCFLSRRSVDGDPLLPHPLLLADDTESRARRIKKYFDDSQLASIGWQPVKGVPIEWNIPPADSERLLSRLSVTAFRDYLACPYRFYLRHVAKLDRMDDALDELTPLQFGSLIHDVLDEWGRDPCRTSTSADVLRRFFHDALDRRWGKFADRPLPALAIQWEQIRDRLLSFADWQAEWARAGWETIHVEVEPRGSFAPFEVDGQVFELTGRVDRIDRNTRENRWAILDYKTSDKGDPPRATHQKSGEWIDLQLPLYRHLLAAIDPSVPLDRLTLGYVTIEKSAVGEKLADWTDEELKDADDLARWVVRQLRAGHYEPASETAGRGFPEYARICQDMIHADA